LGLAVDEVIVKNLKLPEAVEKAMDKRTTLGVFDGKMSEYAQYESVGAMRDAAKNPGTGGAFAGMGIGLGAGTRVGAQFANNMDRIFEQHAKKQVECSNCGAKMPFDAKFCSNCGTKNGGVEACAKCGTILSAGAKFCPECGAPTSATCPKCNATIKGGVKFCPECGEKLK
jgi:membrane protease subunit (stomatin/prohibitin family)